MFSSLGWGEVLMLLLFGLLIFGPDQLPKIAGDLGRMIRQLRRMATDASADLRSELGPEFDDVDLASLNPRTFIQKHVLGDLDDFDDPPRKPRPRRDDGNAATATPVTPTQTEPMTAVDSAADTPPAPYDVDAT